MNLKNSFPEKSAKELLRIEKGSYKHLADLFVEIIKYQNISEKEIRKRCKFTNMEILHIPYRKNKSSICTLAHYGNWEWITHINELLPQRILSVYKPLHNEVEDKFMIKIRERFGAMTVAKNQILRVLARREKKGERSLVGLVSDQAPKDKKNAHWMQFLHQDTAVFLGGEKIAKMFDLPVFFVYSKKLKRGFYELEIIPITTTPKETAEFEITEKQMRLTEQMIQEAPAYWMWTHKRWKYKRKND